jgi:4'-phosphopantetheinyl transferase
VIPGTRWLARGEDHLPADLRWLTEAEAGRAAAMRFPKRRTEFLVARWTARQAGRLLLGVPDLEVRHHPSGAPEAYAGGRPLNVGISLTDRAGWAVCLLGLEPAALGCDLELVEPRSAAFVADYFTPAERAFSGTDPLRANLVWSAKESALKVLRTGLRRDTRSVEVTVGAEGDGWNPLTVRAVEGRSFPGWWRRFGDFVLTTCAVRPTTPPGTPEDPPALAAAIPRHTWMT